jgi:predicted MFS family arabinose efflux permease
VSNSYALRVADRRQWVGVMGLRAATIQLGYFGGSGVAGLALSVGGYPALGLVLGIFFVAAAAALVDVPWGTRVPVTTAA